MIALLLSAVALAQDPPAADSLQAALELSPDGAFVLRFCPPEAWISAEVRVGAEQSFDLGPLPAGEVVTLHGRAEWAAPMLISVSGALGAQRGFTLSLPIDPVILPSQPPNLREALRPRDGSAGSR